MAQWDVYPNPSLRMRETYPYLVDVQSDLLSALETRLVIPLAPMQTQPAQVPQRLCPLFRVDGKELALLAQEAGPIDARLLKKRLVSLRSEAHRIVDALDAVVSGI